MACCSVDPMMHHALRQDTRDIYVPLSGGATSAATSGSGFDVPTPQFDPRVEEWKGEGSGATDSNNATGSSWFKW